MLEIEYKDRTALIERLGNWSMKAPDVANFFRSLIRNSDFDDDLKANGIVGYVGDPRDDASRLVDWARTIDTNPVDRNKALGTILLPMLRGGIGLEDRTFIAGLVVTYRLVSSQTAIDELKARYQIPERPAPRRVDKAAAPIITGPEVQWAARTHELELQGFWSKPKAQVLEVATILTAAKRARGVCRVEVAGLGDGTGLLISRDLVLTNYHVMGGNLAAGPEVLAANAPKTTLRFGAFTAKGEAAAGQKVGLHQEAIVACDKRYDFALLRTDDSIGAAADVEPFAALGPMPVETNPIYVMQHPKGGPMMLALSVNGVTWVDPGLVTLEYITDVAGGSSGSPCFDADWNLIALHHAGHDTLGQGILMQSIFGQIEQYLHA